MKFVNKICLNVFSFILKLITFNALWLSIHGIENFLVIFSIFYISMYIYLIFMCRTLLTINS